MRMGDYPPGVTGNEIEINGIDDMWIPDECCKYCALYDGESCMKEWNNGDKEYYIPERDDRDEMDSCEDYDWNGKYLEEPKEPVKPLRENFVTDIGFRYALGTYFTERRKWSKAMDRIRRDDDDRC